MGIKLVTEADLDQGTDTASFNNAKPFSERASDPEYLKTIPPTFGQVWKAEARKNTITGSLIGYNGMTTEQQKNAEEEDRETLSRAGFWQGMAAGITQPENVALIAGMVAVPGLAGTGMAARAGRIGYVAAEALTREVVLHNIQETRTMDESVAYTLGSVLLGGVGAEAAGAGVRGLVARRAAAGSSVEADVGRSFVNSVKPLAPKADIPAPMIVDDLLNGIDPKLAQSFKQGKQADTPLLAAADDATYHDGGAMQVRGTAISNASDTPFADSGAMKLGRTDGSKAVLSTWFDNAEKWATDRTTKGLSSFNQRVIMQGGEEVKGYSSKLMPMFRMTQQAVDGTGQNMSVYSTRTQIVQEYTTRINRIHEETYPLAREQIKKVDVNELALEIQTRSGMTPEPGQLVASEALQAARSIKDSANAAGTRVTSTLKNKINELISLTGRNGDHSVISSLGRAAGRLRKEVMEPIVRRGAAYGIYDEGMLTASRETALSYWPRRWNKNVIRNDQDAFIQEISPYITSESRSSWTATSDIMKAILRDEELQIVKTGGGLGIKVDGELVLDMIPDNVAARFLINDTDALMKGYVQAGSKEIAPAEVFKRSDWQEAMKEHRLAVSREYDDQVRYVRENLPDGPELDRAINLLARDMEERKTLMAYAEQQSLGNGPSQHPAVRT